MKIRGRRVDLIELLLVAALAAALGYAGGRHRTELRLRPYLSDGGAELAPLEARYGGHHDSRYGEEWIIRDFFQDERGGVFADVGANHYRRDSNTYFLETQLGWSGVAIEPQTRFAADYARHRPRTQFVPLFVSDISNRQAQLYVPADDLVASGDRAFAEAEGGTATPMSVNTTTLDDVLERSGISRLDFVSLDVELHEPQALKGFSIERFRPRLVVVEAHLPVRQAILDYFARHGYVTLGKYLRADAENLWFAPIAGASAPTSSGTSTESPRAAASDMPRTRP